MRLQSFFRTTPCLRGAHAGFRQPTHQNAPPETAPHKATANNLAKLATSRLPVLILLALVFAAQFPYAAYSDTYKIVYSTSGNERLIEAAAVGRPHVRR